MALYIHKLVQYEHIPHYLHTTELLAHIPHYLHTTLLTITHHSTTCVHTTHTAHSSARAHKHTHPYRTNCACTHHTTRAHTSHKSCTHTSHKSCTHTHTPHYSRTNTACTITTILIIATSRGNHAAEKQASQNFKRPVYHTFANNIYM